MNTDLIRSLRLDGKHEEARILALRLISTSPTDATLLYETACVHDFLGFEAEAIPLYVAAIENGLQGDTLRNALLGLGSSYRTLGQYDESLVTLEKAIKLFPGAQEMVVFRAMALYNIGEFKEAVASLLGVINRTTNDPIVQRLERAISLYAEDLDRKWE